MAATIPVRRPASTVEWNETAAMAVERMRATDCDCLTVVDCGRTLGRLTRADIERCRRQGNWLDAVMVVDLVGRPAAAER